MAMKRWLIFAGRALLAAGSLQIAVSGIADAAENQKRLAFSKKLGIEVFAHRGSGEKTWCKERVILNMNARQSEFYKSGTFTKLATKLGAIVSKECPKAISANIQGKAEDADGLVFQGIVQKENQWKLESKPAQTQSVASSARVPPPPPPPIKPISSSAKSPGAEIGGVWKGSYVCGQGKTGLNLTIRPESGNRVTGVFAFFLKDGRYGKFNFSGQYDPRSKVISAKPGSWITRIQGFNPVPFDARLSGDGRNLVGKINVRGCRGLSVRRAPITVTPTPITTAGKNPKPPSPSSNQQIHPSITTIGVGKPSRLRALSSLSTVYAQCRELLNWFRNIDREYDYKFKSAAREYGDNYVLWIRDRDYANLYRNREFVALFGKPFNQMSVRELSSINKRFSRPCLKYKDIGKEWERKMDYGFHPFRSNSSRKYVLKRIKEDRINLKWRDQKIAELSMLSPSEANKAKLNRWESEGNKQLAALWPSEKKLFTSAILKAKTKLFGAGSLNSLPTLLSKCRAILHWVNRMKQEYDYDYNVFSYKKIEYAKRHANLFRDHDFATLFSKPFLELKLSDDERILISKNLRNCPKELMSASIGIKYQFGKHPTAIWILNVIPALKFLTTYRVNDAFFDFVREGQISRKWMDQNVAKIASLPVSVESLEKLNNLERKGEKQLADLWPSEQKMFANAISMARKKMSEPALMAKIEQFEKKKKAAARLASDKRKEGVKKKAENFRIAFYKFYGLDPSISFSKAGVPSEQKDSSPKLVGTSTTQYTPSAPIVKTSPYQTYRWRRSFIEPRGPTFAGMIGRSIGQALNSMRNLKDIVWGLTRNVVVARRNYWDCDGTCANKRELETTFSDALAEKDLYYAIVVAMSGRIGDKYGAGGNVVRLLKGASGEVDDGINQKCVSEFSSWSSCISTDIRNVKACRQQYEPYQLCRDYNEFDMRSISASEFRDPISTLIALNVKTSIPSYMSRSRAEKRVVPIFERYGAKKVLEAAVIISNAQKQKKEFRLLRDYESLGCSSDQLEYCFEKLLKTNKYTDTSANLIKNYRAKQRSKNQDDLRKRVTNQVEKWGALLKQSRNKQILKKILPSVRNRIYKEARQVAKKQLEIDREKVNKLCSDIVLEKYPYCLNLGKKVTQFYKESEKLCKEKFPVYLKPFNSCYSSRNQEILSDAKKYEQCEKYGYENNRTCLNPRLKKVQQDYDNTVREEVKKRIDLELYSISKVE